MLTQDNLYRIVITGPESTGKTQLAQELAQGLNATWVPEYARAYVENLGRPYTYNDVIQIASYQIAQEQEFDAMSTKGILIFDTWLIITKVWLDLVYGKCPDWICDHIRTSKIDLFLVCDTDLPWIADPVRENGGEKRNELFRLYCNEISTFGFKYEIVSGFGDFRTNHAMISLSKHGMKL